MRRIQFLVLCTIALISLPTAAAPSGRRTLPIVFEANRGQAPAGVGYVFHREGMAARFSADAVDFLFGSLDARGTVRMSFSDVKAAPEGREQLSGHANYFIGSDPGKWLKGVPIYSRLRYHEVYPGVDLEFYGNGAELEHDFIVSPGADPSQIVLRLSGPLEPRMENGDLLVGRGDAALRVRRPVAFQMIGSQRRLVQADMTLQPGGLVRFRVGKYDRKLPLVIDPVYVFASYLGGTGGDAAKGVGTDAAGNILVTGYTSSTDFPVQNAEQEAMGGCNKGLGCQNAFISKFDPTGATLIYSTYLGGSTQDRADALAVDTAGNAIVAGYTSSPDFPTAGALAGATPSCVITSECYFIASLSADGSKLNYSGPVGGHANPGSTYGVGSDGDVVVLATDASRNAYLSGVTWDPNFLVTPGTLAGSFEGYPYAELFVLKVDETGKVVYSTPVPGNAGSDPATNNNEFDPAAMVVDSAGNAILVGTAAPGLPTTAGVVGQQFPNPTANYADPVAGFVLQLNAAASAINYASYLPGTDYAYGVAQDGSGNLWIAGATVESTLPVSANAFMKTLTAGAYNTMSSGYVMELKGDATAVLGATYLNGSGKGNEEYTSLSAIALDSHGTVYMGGTTGAADFPMVNPFATEWETQVFVGDMVLAALSPDLSTLKFGSFLNPAGDAYSGSYFAGLAIDKADHLITVGSTYTTNFMTTPGSFEPTAPLPPNSNNTPSHVFVAKFDMSAPAPAVCFDTLNVTFGNVNANTSQPETLHVTNCGNAPLNISAITSTDPKVTASQSCGAIAPGAVCPVTLTFTPVSSDATTGSVTLTDDAQTVPQTVNFNGQGIAPKIVPQVNPLVMGHYVVGTSSPAIPLLIWNQGQANLKISSMTVSGTGFSIASNDCLKASYVSSGWLCEVDLMFSPSAAGQASGSLKIVSDDPVTPTLNVALKATGDSLYGVPVIQTATPGTVQIGGPDVTIAVTGSNFYPQSVVQLNGTPLTTTFMNNGDLQAVLPAGTVKQLGERTLAVANPAPGGGLSNALFVTPYQVVNIFAAALASVPQTGFLYAAVPDQASTNPNTVIPLDPTTGAPGTPITTGNNPRLLAPSSDGSYLFVANQGDYTLQRIKLKSNSVEKTFPYTPNIYCPTCTNAWATDLQTVPGSPQQVLLSQGSWLSLYNDAGLVNYVPNDGICCYADPDFGSTAIAGNPQMVYALPFTLDGVFFQTAALTSSGLQYTRRSETNYGGNTKTGGQVVSDGTLLYTSAGEIWDPSTQTQVGTFPVKTDNSTSYPDLWSLTLDTALGQIYTLGDETVEEDSDAAVITAYGMQSHAVTGKLVLDMMAPSASNLVRWGNDGFAFIGPGSDVYSSAVYLVRSSVASGLSMNPTPVLNSMAPVTSVAGSADFTITANGSGFVSGSVVEWNGTALKTSFVSSQKLTVTVPAADVAVAGTAQVSVYSPAPGGGSSVAQDFTIVAAGPAATLSADQLAFGSQTQGVKSAAQNVTLTNTGNAALNITSVTADGDFSVSVGCGSSLAVNASCTIAVTFTPAATGTRTGTLTIADNASGSPQKVGLSGNGLAAMTFSPGQGGSTSATVSSGGTATYNLSLTTAPGISGSIALTCSGAPQYSTCTLSPQTLNLTSGQAGPFTVTVVTESTTTAARSSGTAGTVAGIGALSLAGLILFRRKPAHSILNLLGVFIITLALAAVLSSCGGGGGNSGGGGTVTQKTPSGTYSLTITAQGAGAAETQTLTLVVK